MSSFWCSPASCSHFKIGVQKVYKKEQAWSMDPFKEESNELYVYLILTQEYSS